MRFGVDGLDMHQQRVIAQVAALRVAGPADEVLVVPGHADLGTRHCTEIDHTRRWRWMKAYFNQYRLSTRGLRRCRFSQDVALHRHARQFGAEPADLHLLGAHRLASTPLSLRCFWALTQLDSVWSTTPSVRAAAAMLCSPALSLTQRRRAEA